MILKTKKEYTRGFSLRKVAGGKVSVSSKKESREHKEKKKKDEK